MGVTFAAAAIALALGVLLLLLIIRYYPYGHKDYYRYSTNNKSAAPSSATNLPPGSFGWPIIGETFMYFRALRGGSSERFIRDRMDSAAPARVFKTGMLGHPTAVFCGNAAHKFLFGNESKLVRVWWPPSVHKLFGHCLVTAHSDSEAKRLRKILSTSLHPDALIKYVNTMDAVTRHHISSLWQGKDQVTVYPTVKLYTFELACRLFMSFQDPLLISKLSARFNVFLKGVINIPLNFPGTPFYRAMKAANAIRDELRKIVRQRKLELGMEHMIITNDIAEQQSSSYNTSSTSQDLLSHLLVTSDEQGRFLNEVEIINNILLLLFAGHDTSCSVITMLIKYLGELPQVNDCVFTEQMEIANSKGGDLLEWEDIQKMRYSWHVVSEVMRLTPPVSGGFREALVDFSYEGYTIPKGWKLFWSPASTQRDPTLFPNAEEFDPSRFDGTGLPPFSYVPFGGGTRMCLGKEYARLEILVFLHNLVKNFKWELLIPGEKIGYDPMATPAKGLPIRLFPHSPRAVFSS
ncbi:hypothetical protein Ancab_000004 [Ancistrocladus abbreviatus]